MDSRAPAVVAVIVTTGSGPGLEATAASLAAQNYEELSLLVVANGDAPHVPARVAAVAPNAFVRILEENRGFGPACNEAALMIEGSAFFLFCHDDVRLEPDAVQLMVEAAYRTNAGVVTPKVVAYEDPLVLLHAGQTCDRFGVVRERVELGEIDHGQQDLERDVFVAPGGVTLVRADLFTTLRGFDPLITLLGEDLDLCWRAQVAGARIVVAPLAKVAHRETIATGERSVTAIGTRGASRQDLQRRHQLLVVATGWGRRQVVWTLLTLFVIDVFEVGLSLASADLDRAGAIIGSWRWLIKQRRRVRQRRRQLHRLRVLSDAELHRLQVGGASRLKHFFVTLLREGYDKARGILPPDDTHELEEETEAAGVGFAAAFSEDEEFDEIAESGLLELRTRPSRFMTSFRSQATVVSIVAVAWLIGSRNLVAIHLPLVGRLAPLDSWWSTWRHFFASWSSNGVGSGSPGMPGYGVLAFAGTFVFGRMGVLPRLALILAVPIGAVGVGQILKDRASNRARVFGAVAYAAMPLGVNMISQGRVDVLVVVAGLPYIVRRIFALMDVPGFRPVPYSEPVPFGHRGWRTTESGQRMVLIMLIAIVSAMAPATLVVVALVVVGVVVARLFEPDPDVSFRGSFRFLGSLLVNVAIFLIPMTINVAFAGRRALEIFGLARGPWSVPTFSYLLRDVDGTFGTSWWGWLLPLAALFALVLCKGDRRRAASKALVIAALTLVLAAVVSRHWLGSFSPDLDVLLALYAVMLATLIGLGIAALEHDLRDAGFGWRQIVAGLSVATLLVATLPFLATFGSGRFDLPTTSVAESLSALTPSTAGGFRVLWLGDPSVVPLPGWSVAPGLEAATSMNGLPGGANLFNSPDSGTSDVIMQAVQSALAGHTVRLGELLAPAGIATIVVMNSSAPELSGVQNVPLHRPPGELLTALNNQSDLSLDLQTSSVEVFSNSLFHGIVAATNPGSTSLSPIFSTNSFSGPLTAGSTVVAGLAPAGAFALDVNGTAAPRTTQGSWTPFYNVAPTPTGPVGTIVLHQFPLNGLIALFTLGMWGIVWLGFGWVHRLEWLFTGRRRVVTARVPKDDDV
ncbi:MAG TPA: glycosyltransferase family 2 protein [Acidimicrobiales bacterium]|jgi:GT2 family glycosyltransferase|nr:glycosyltransferase family 2 protein [Acidimicrobiales bacterium]